MLDNDRWSTEFMAAADAAPPYIGKSDAESSGKPAGKGKKPPKIAATPFVWRDPASIPRREWLYGVHLIRKYVSLTVAPGAAGKSSLLITTALALATGNDLLGCRVHDGPHRVWLWNLEDPREELERRIAATMIHYDMAPEDIGDHLFIDSGRDQGLCIARQEGSGFEILEPVVDALVAELAARRIDVLIVDPFVSSHTVEENSNGAIDAVAKTWGRVAERANCAIELVHHLRKLNGVEATAESARGAGALVAAARSVAVLNKMTREEGQKAGLDGPGGYFRVGDDKNNLAPPINEADWFRLVSVPLPNGDNVGVVERWFPPKPLDDVTVGDLYAVQKAVAGKGYRADSRSPDWIGYAIAGILELDADDKAAREKIKGALKIWLKSGALVERDIVDAVRRKKRSIDVGAWVAAPVLQSARVEVEQTGAVPQSALCSSAPVAPVPYIGTEQTDWSGAPDRRLTGAED